MYSERRLTVLGAAAFAGLVSVGLSWFVLRRRRRLRKPAPIQSLSSKRARALALFLSDMDGTWLSPHHAPTEGGVHAIAEAEAAGLLFAFATGRCARSAQAASRVDLERRPGIYANGSVVRGAGGRELYALDLPEVRVAAAHG